MQRIRGTNYVFAGITMCIFPQTKYILQKGMLPFILYVFILWIPDINMIAKRGKNED